MFRDASGGMAATRRMIFRVLMTLGGVSNTFVSMRFSGNS